MSGSLQLVVALALVLAGAALVATEAHDIWRAREFWAAIRSGQPQPVPDFWDDRYVMAPLTLWTPKVLGGGLLGLCGAALLLVRLRAGRAESRATRRTTSRAARS